MASMWQKAMVYLGLGPDEEYEDYEAGSERRRAPSGPVVAHRDPPVGTAQAQGEPRAAAPQRATAGPRPTDSGGERRNPQRSTTQPRTPERPPPPPAARDEVSAVRPLPTPGKPEAPTPKQRTVVRPVPAVTTPKPHVVSPSSFNSAQDVADKFKSDLPVVLNLQGVDRDLARRLIDFSSGLCYGLGGHMEKVAHQVYLLTPENVEISAEDRRRLSTRS